MTQPRCDICHIELPTSATGPWCDDHEDGQELPIPDPAPPSRPARVVHNGLISKRNGGLEEMEIMR